MKLTIDFDTANDSLAWQETGFSLIGFPSSAKLQRVFLIAVARCGKGKGDN